MSASFRWQKKGGGRGLRRSIGGREEPRYHHATATLPTGSAPYYSMLTPWSLHGSATRDARAWRGHASVIARAGLQSRQHAGTPVLPACLICRLRGGDDGVALFGGLWPAVCLLPGADEDART